MNPVVMHTVARLMAPVLLLVSLVLAVRGHDIPGGGFVGGLMAATAFALLMVAFGRPAARKQLRVHPTRLAAAGLLVALFSGVPPMMKGRPFLSGIWGRLPVPGTDGLKVGTPQLFDLGIYLVVLGTAMCFILGMARGEDTTAPEMGG
ncbi:Na+/H+ antiporter subunit B [Myxococcus virescens]|uniref:Multisubunit sodium/proton antiporter, MrpB subunit (TC 2.A.63.1) n=1 Tax=Myxococcus virescens TaxID=83456 RepID=A0A511HDU9_9BACT|nr:Na+/H+ antiporter subunit B [Myxococcus virescens]GEL71727.1 Na(+)/H(+) antiporter subunit B [Myxococcus virescens]SDF04367.1 multisubunit sodium/proton antiporter, MrpB subunit (TC 2.A.63.1) [Myxococcus virescens]